MRSLYSIALLGAVSLLAVLTQACKKASVEGTYSGAFNGMMMTPATTGGMRMTPQAAAADVTLTGDNPTTVAFEASFSNSDGKNVQVKCALKATRTGDPDKGDATLQIADQECAGGATPAYKFEGTGAATRGESGFDALKLDIKTTSRWGGAGEPQAALTLSFSGKRKK
jgi:hypothetical protein